VTEFIVESVKPTCGENMREPKRFGPETLGDRHLRQEADLTHGFEFTSVANFGIGLLEQHAK
jgi:hypothetical protein